MSGAALFTVVARNYLAYARTLMASVAEFEPSFDRFVFVVDVTDHLPAIAGATVLAPADVFDYEFFAGLAYSSDVTELSTAVKPFVLRALFDRGHASAYYFDPDIELFASLDPVTIPLANADLVLTPHITEPIPLDGKLPDEIVLLRAGAYNLGFIGVSRTPSARAMLDWWADRLARYCVNDVDTGLFTDQKWIDLVPGLVERVAIVRHRGCNVAYWNLHERRIDGADTRRLESGEPLVFFHYSGFDVGMPNRLSKHQTRIEVQGEPALAALLRGYAARVTANGFAQSSATPYGYARFSNGVSLDQFSRGVLREARLDGVRFPDPNDASAYPSAWRYLNEEAPEDANRRGAQALTRYMYSLWRMRKDLHTAFPDVLGADRGRFVAWLQSHRANRVHGGYLAAAGMRSVATAAEPRCDGVNVAGYFRTESGIGEAGRGLIAALQEALIPVRVLDISELAPSRSAVPPFAGSEGPGDHRINLVCVNADQMPVFVDRAGPAFFSDCYNIGSWWWELPQFPEAWTPSFEPFDEIWAGTQFVAAAISPKSPVPVVLIPPVVDVGAVRSGRKAEFGFRDDETTFSFVYDYRSVFDRKNPLGAIEAFRRAFPDPREKVRLVLKSINADVDPRGHERVRCATLDDPRITQLDGYLTRRQKNEFLAACDAYVSLHRSEGFGYTIAEAMLLGKPVIATPWSGPADYMTAVNSFPVAYELVELGEDYGPYAAEQRWAEPDLDDAACAMRSVHAEPGRAALLGERASADIIARYSPVAVAKVIVDRIQRIRSNFRLSAQRS